MLLTASHRVGGGGALPGIPAGSGTLGGVTERYRRAELFHGSEFRGDEELDGCSRWARAVEYDLNF
eukprot:7927987-Pyramimonas_sp.AAC.2